MFRDEEWNKLYRYCFSLTKKNEMAYDLLHSAVEKYLSNPPLNVESKQAYIRRIARNHFIDLYRKDQRFPTENLNGEEPIDITTEPLEKTLINQQELQIIWRELNSEESELMFLWAAEGLTAQAIANELELPRGTVLSRIHRIRKKLHRILNPEAFKEAP